MLQYEQYKLTASIAEEYANAEDFDVRFSHTVTGLKETADGVEVEYTSPDGPDRMMAAYVIGCDGGRSTVRKLSDIEFEGFTYPERFIKIATTFDFETVNPNLCLRNYFSDPDEWANLFKVRGERPPGLWRVILPVAQDEDDATALSPERVEARLQKFFPKAGRYDVEYVNVYGVHQRVAATFRKGRILLAGDSAHVNNPIGGMGMNGGIHDGINLAEKLAKVIHGEADDELLDLYSRQRHHAAVKYVQAQTIANKRLMEERDPAVRAEELRRIAPHRGKPGDGQGLYAPRGAVRQPARRCRGDLSTGHARMAAILGPRARHPAAIVCGGSRPCAPGMRSHIPRPWPRR